MQSQNISSSSISDASEIRYQKAVREISKLIGLNNALKRDADNFRTMCQNLQIQNKELFQRYQELVNEKRSFNEQIKKYELAIKEYELKIESYVKHESELSASKMMEERTKQNQASAILNEKLNQQGNTIMSLQENVAQLQSIIKDLRLNNERLNSQKQEQKGTNLHCLKCSYLKQQIHNDAQYRMKLEKEIIEIKKYRQPGMTVETVPIRHRSAKDQLLASYDERLRLAQEKYKRKDIEAYRLRDRLEKVEAQLSKQKARQKLLETTTMQLEVLQK